MQHSFTSRIVIENVLPQVNKGRYPIKRITDEPIIVTADILCDGHDRLDAEINVRYNSGSALFTIPMIYVDNDNWRGTFAIDKAGDYTYQICSWVDTFSTWQQNFVKKYGAGQATQSDIKEGYTLITSAALKVPSDLSPLLNEAADDLIENSSNQYQCYLIATDNSLTEIMKKYQDRSNFTISEIKYPLMVNQKNALFSAWYEFFPRSFKPVNGQSVFKSLDTLLSRISLMGFDTIYFPPIHPIGITNRKGKNNKLYADPNEPGSPWAIGSALGGHKSIDPDLGSLEDFRSFVHSAEKMGIRVAIDLAFQCSPDHPYCQSNPEWFKFRPDGSIQFAENPPKKYEDIVPFNFDSKQAQSLWKELLSVVLFWIDQGISVFRVDNPHTKPLPFWEWLIKEVRESRGDVHFLSEAFTRPKIMYQLGKTGFTQSYTYFTWRNSKIELEQYIGELTQSNVSQFFRPNFWPNTPDILPEFLQHGGKQSFAIRFILASLLSSNYGIYGPVFEHCICQSVTGKEEYFDSEKYEIKNWNTAGNDYLIHLITTVNSIRRQNPALQQTNNITLLQNSSDSVLAFCKFSSDRGNILIVLINIDPFHRHQVSVNLSELLGSTIDSSTFYLEELIGGEQFFQTESNLELDMGKALYPAYILRVKEMQKDEHTFSYY
jgi:starch synthase (maltosyl-transferring)